MRHVTILAERIDRIGRQRLLVDGDGQHYVAIRNRTYRACHPIPDEAVARWLAYLSRARYA